MTLRGLRTYRPGLMRLAAVAPLVGLAVTGALVARLHGGAARYAPWLVLGSIAVFYALMIAAHLRRPATLELTGDGLRTSWGAVVPRGPVTLGRWVLAGVDTPVGVAAHVGGLRIGGVDHPGDGYALAAGPTRVVDLELAGADLDALLAALGVPRAPTTGDLAIELVRSSQTTTGALATMAPWLLTIAAVSVFGGVLAATGLGERLLRTPHGTIWIGAATAAIVVAGLVWTVARSMRPRRPTYELRADAGGLALARPRGAEEVRVPWSAVRAEPRQHVVRSKVGTWTVPALALALGDRVVVLGAWDHHGAWPGTPPRATPTWLVGKPQWAQLVARLRWQRVLAA